MAKKVTVWSAIGSAWTAWWLFVMIWITIYDLPPGSTYWSWCIDTTGYWHEMALPLMIWASGMAALLVTSFWYAAVAFLNEMRFVGVSPDGKPILYKRRDSAVAPQWTPSCRAAIDRRLQRVLKHK